MNRSYKMYGIVADNISSLQKGIQFGKAIVKYGEKYNSDGYRKWLKLDMETVLLSGGTTNSRRFNGDYIGTINKHLDVLNKNNIKNTSIHYEKDLGDQLTVIAFLVDDRVWDLKKYPDYDGPWQDHIKKEPFEIPYKHWLLKFGEEGERENVFFLRKFLKNFKEI